MALKFFGANRMAAQQGAEDRGTSLVSRRPSWGLGPQGMPGSSDYNPNPQRGAFMRDAGGSSTPNAYERGGFFWDGSGIRQGTPIAHQDQRLDHNEQDNARRWATAALEDKRHGVQVRDVDARIRQADERIGHERGRLDLEQGRFDLAQEGQQFDQGMRTRGLKLDERREERADRGFAFEQDVRRRGIAMDEESHGVRMKGDRLRLDDARDASFSRPSGRAQAAAEGQQAVAGLLKASPGRFTPRSAAAALRSGDVTQLQPEDVVTGQEERWLARLQQINPKMRAVARNGTPTDDGMQYLQRVNELSRVPEFYGVTDEDLAQLAADGAYKDMQDGRWYAQKNGRIYLVDIN